MTVSGDGGEAGVARLCVAVLAAGAASRMGASKLTMPLAGTTSLALALEAACGCADGLAGAEVVVVTGAHREEVAHALEAFRESRGTAGTNAGGDAGSGVGLGDVRDPLAPGAPLRELVNPAWADGQASSVRVAAGHVLSCGFDALLVLAGDQPLVRPRHLVALATCWLAAPESADVWRAAAGARRGNPCLFARRCLPDLLALEGDEGARALFRARPDLRVSDVELGDPLLFEDLDAPGDAPRLEAELLARTDRDEGVDAPGGGAGPASPGPGRKEASHAIR